MPRRKRGTVPHFPPIHSVIHFVRNITAVGQRFHLFGPAVNADNLILSVLVPEFGYHRADANYNLKFRNPVFSFFTAERLLILYSEKGIDGLRTELKKLRAEGII